MQVDTWVQTDAATSPRNFRGQVRLLVKETANSHELIAAGSQARRLDTHALYDVPGARLNGGT